MAAGGGQWTLIEFFVKSNVPMPDTSQLLLLFIVQQAFDNFQILGIKSHNYKIFCSRVVLQ